MCFEVGANMGMKHRSLNPDRILLLRRKVGCMSMATLSGLGGTFYCFYIDMRDLIIASACMTFAKFFLNVDGESDPTTHGTSVRSPDPSSDVSDYPLCGR